MALPLAFDHVALDQPQQSENERPAPEALMYFSVGGIVLIVVVLWLFGVV